MAADKDETKGVVLKCRFKEVLSTLGKKKKALVVHESKLKRQSEKVKMSHQIVLLL